MTRQEKYIRSLEEQIVRQRQTIGTLRAELERKKRQTAVMADRTLRLFLSLGYTPEEVLRYYAVSHVNRPNLNESKEDE